MRKTNLVIIMMFLTSILFAQDLPSNPEPGKCYVKCITKDEFKDVEETIESYPAYNRLEVIPATYKTVTEQVLVKEESKIFEIVPAAYDFVDVTYISRSKSSTLQVVPASFGSDRRTYEVYPRTSGWQYKTLENCSSPNKTDCVTACFVEFPAQTRDVVSQPCVDFFCYWRLTLNDAALSGDT